MLTIIVPNYNNEKYLVETLHSIQNQTFSDFKCIIIDDNSTDNSIDVIKQTINNDSRFQLIQNHENKGVAFSRNLGITTATTKFILPLDADDILEKTYIARALDFFTKYPMYNLYYGRWYFFGYNADYMNQTLGTLHYTHYRRLLSSNQIHCSCVYKREEAIKCGLYDSSLLGYEDWEFLIRLLNEDSLVFYDPNISLYYRQHEKSRSTDDHNHVNAIYNQVILKHINLYKQYNLVKISQK